MNRFSFILLSILFIREATNPYQGLTLKDLMKAEKMEESWSTYYRAIKKLVLDGLVQQGAKEGRADTYYITKQGITRREELTF